MKEEIVAKVRQIDDLNRQIADHWSRVQRHITEKRVNEAISLLNAYFRLKMKLNEVESSLESSLKSQFADN